MQKEEEEITILGEGDRIKPIFLGRDKYHKRLRKYSPEPEPEPISKKVPDGIKPSNYIIGQKTTNDKQFCEPVDPLDIHSTAEIRKYITAAEIWTNKAEKNNLTYEAKNRMIKYVVCFLLGAGSILWALYAGMINLTK